ncbi:transporter [Pseudomonas aeruginosa]|uniref:transporter n=1 Tax=Pseudomonas aeruginosa TaxID=287 RepID=UPI000514248B|nr:transporter [Pseudomonas aeruginosa]MBX6190285.1 transporter [Pseudomonas aeruginosa]MBX6716959.1 transporter [Pseudomonas aeruginosa]MBX6872438.1 transporter [Pseudomonas aeruginosa]QKL12987.1 transporter [Pseudomonas aeruginosa]QQV96162.1 transporter [Pseudomonas aeruginosa]
MKNRTKELLLLSSLLPALPTTCLALDIDGGDYTPLPDGTNMALLYYHHGYSHSAYSHGNNVGGGSHLTQDVGILRMIHFMDVAGFTMDPQFLLPFGHVQGKQAGTDLGTGNGLGDLILANTVWLVNDPASRTYFGVTPMITLPTGNYDKDDPLNIGENRHKYTLQLGFSQELIDRLTLDAAFDGTHFGDNDRYGSGKSTLSQRTLYQGQVIFRYDITPNLDIRTSYSRQWGGEQFVDGVSQGRPNQSKYTIGTAYMLPTKTQLILGWGRDTSIDNGFKTSSQINLRIAQVF